MQQPAPTAPTAPPSPNAPALPGQATTVTVPLSAVPQTAAEVQATRIKIEDLRTQLQDFAERRNSVASQLRNADIDARPGYQARLANLDVNINALQNQITQATLALSNAPAVALVGATSQRGVPTFGPPGVNFAVSRASNVLSVVAIAAIAFIAVRFAFRRVSTARTVALADPETANNIRQLQQSVDSIAIEVERISEAQRFVTRVLAERDRPELGVGPTPDKRVH